MTQAPPGHRRLGDGPAKVLVLPGWFGDEALLEPVAAYLDTAAFSYATLAYRGTGASRDAVGACTLEEIAADALALADALGWERFALVGHSMGGKAALAVLLRAPARIRGIVAITPVPAGRVPFDAAGWALFCGAAEDVGKRARIIELSTGGRLTPGFARQLARRSMERGSPAAFRAYLDAWACSDIAAAVGSRDTSLLAIVGAHDPQLTETVIRDTYLASFAGARLEVIADAGHYPIDETPILLATLMETFLAGLA